MTFKVGDRVRVVPHSGVYGGRTGVVVTDPEGFWQGEVPVRLDDAEGYYENLGYLDFHPIPPQFLERDDAPVAKEPEYATWELELLANDGFVKSVDAVLDTVKRTLLEKNAAYGNSVLDPVRIFSKADPVEQLRVRLDDKISRLQRGTDAGEDTILDLLGYLVLLKIAESND